MRAATKPRMSASMAAPWNMNYGPDGDLAPAYGDNPYFTRYKNVETDSRERYFGNAFVTYKAYSWLNLTAKVSIDNYNDFYYQENYRRDY